MNNCANCKYWTSYGHSNRGDCEKLMKSFGLEVHLVMGEDAVEKIVTRGDFGCTDFREKQYT